MAEHRIENDAHLEMMIQAQLDALRPNLDKTTAAGVCSRLLTAVYPPFIRAIYAEDKRNSGMSELLTAMQVMIGNLLDHVLHGCIAPEQQAGARQQMLKRIERDLETIRRGETPPGTERLRSKLGRTS